MIARVLNYPWGWASLAPLACAAHCALAPLAILFAPALVPGEPFEWALLGFSVFVGGFALIQGTRRHRDSRPIVPVVAGLSLWFASLLHLFHPLPEEVTTVAATLIVAAGLLWNARLHRSQSGCSCSVCESG